jgi:RNA polymerase sigma-70 factor (ECF subfamily)
MRHLTYSMPPSSTTSLALLVSRIRAGHADALGELYARAAGRLATLAQHLTGSRQDAEDVVHDVFLGLPEALRHYDEQGQFEAWLRRVTARVALTRVRGLQRLREHGLEGDLPHVPTTLSLDDKLALSSAVDALPDGLRTVIVLKMIEGYSHDEIAALLAITPRASEQRLHRAMKALRLRFTPPADTL